LGLAIFARRLGRRAPTPRHTYGLKRAEVVAALINAAALIAISALIGREAVARLFHPEPVRASVMLLAAAVAFLANVGSVLLLRTHSTAISMSEAPSCTWPGCSGLAGGSDSSAFCPNGGGPVR